VKTRSYVLTASLVVALVATLWFAGAALAGPSSCDTRVIADANNGIRTSGTTGYNQSKDYVVQRLTAAGYGVTVQEFQFQTFILLAPTVLDQISPSAGPIANNIMSYSGSGEVTAAGRYPGL